MYLANSAPGHLSPIDGPLLARLCVALAYADEANEKLEDLGLLIKAPNTGLPLQSPYLPVLNRQTEIARKLAAELALPPAQRNRVGPYDADAGPSACLGCPGRMKAPTAAPYPAGVSIAVRYARDMAAGKTRGSARTVVSPHYPVQFVSTVPTGTTGSLKRSDR